MHYYNGPLPTPKTHEHRQFFRPYGKCVYPDGRVVLFNRSYQAIFECRPGQAPTMIASGPKASDESREGEQDIFSFNDGTDPRKANQRIDAELTALGLPPMGPRPRYTIEAKLGLLRARLYQKLQQQFPGVFFYVEYKNRLDAGPCWSGTHEVRVVGSTGPPRKQSRRPRMVLSTGWPSILA